MSTCAVKGCERLSITRGWCKSHYARWRRTGDPGPSTIGNNGRSIPGPAVCVIDGCDQPARVKVRGWCHKHYSAWQRNGDPEAVAPARDKWTAGHGLTGYDEHGCRCDMCKTAKSAKHRERAARIKGSPATPHGTLSGYGSYGCRCAECHDAMLAFQRSPAQADGRRRKAAERRARALGQEPPTHGTTTGYGTYGCTCDECLNAARVSNRRRIEQDLAEQGTAVRSLNREQWTGVDLELVLTRTDLDDRALARMLDRSVKAVRMARYKAKHDPKWMQVVGVTAS